MKKIKTPELSFGARLTQKIGGIKTLYIKSFIIMIAMPAFVIISKKEFTGRQATTAEYAILSACILIWALHIASEEWKEKTHKKFIETADKERLSKKDKEFLRKISKRIAQDPNAPEDTRKTALNYYEEETGRKRKRKGK